MLGELASAVTHGQCLPWRREELGWNGTGCCREACYYKPAMRKSVGSPPESVDLRMLPDQYAARACQTGDELAGLESLKTPLSNSLSVP
jgi:hypothetical protein